MPLALWLASAVAPTVGPDKSSLRYPSCKSSDSVSATQWCDFCNLPFSSSQRQLNDLTPHVSSTTSCPLAPSDSTVPLAAATAVVATNVATFSTKRHRRNPSNSSASAPEGSATCADTAPIPVSAPACASAATEKATQAATPVVVLPHPPRPPPVGATVYRDVPSQRSIAGVRASEVRLGCGRVRGIGASAADEESSSDSDDTGNGAAVHALAACLALPGKRPPACIPHAAKLPTPLSLTGAASPASVVSATPSPSSSMAGDGGGDSAGVGPFAMPACDIFSMRGGSSPLPDLPPQRSLFGNSDPPPPLATGESQVKDGGKGAVAEAEPQTPPLPALVTSPTLARLPRTGADPEPAADFMRRIGWMR